MTPDTSHLAPDTFSSHRSHLFAIAYRMTGSVMDAEDLVQETFLKWQGIPAGTITNPRAYLTTIISRLAIDHLRSAQVQRETYPGTWLPEPLIQDKLMPDESVQLTESVTTAFLILLEQLNPTERAVYLLRQVFDYPYNDIAEIVGKTPTNCRQIVRRASQRIQPNRPILNTTPHTQQRLLTQFATACQEGDIESLLTLLADDITSWSDGGGHVPAARRPIHTPDKVARLFLGLMKQAPAGTELHPVIINQQQGLLITINGQPFGTVSFQFSHNQIAQVYAVINPDKLSHVTA